MGALGTLIPAWTNEGTDHSLSEAVQSLMSMHFRKGQGCPKIDFLLAPHAHLDTTGFQICVPLY